MNKKIQRAVASVAADETLCSALADYFEQPAHPPYILPEHLQGWVRRAFMPAPFGPGYWMDLTSEQRRAAAGAWDAQNTPEAKRESEYWENLSSETSKLKCEIAEWEGMRHQGIPSEAKLRQEQLATLRCQLNSLEKLWELPPFADAGKAPATVALASSAQTDRKQPIVKKPRNKWNDNSLRKLYSESIQPGASIKSLAEQYTLSYEGIRKQLKAAEKYKVGKGPKAASKAWKSGQ